MNPCDESILSAYIDGELDAASRLRVESHVTECPTCAAVLAATRELAESIAKQSCDDLTDAELAHVHDAVAASDDSPILRLGGVLAALAASVLIVAGAWLAQMPATTQSVTKSLDLPQPWERVAMTLRADTPAAQEPTQVAQNDVADWMLDELAGR